MREVLCPYCGRPANLVDSATVYNGRSYGLIWDCRPCDAYVGVHKNSKEHIPLGRLANRDLRQWKVRAHAAFDVLWKKDGDRRGAYRKLREMMGMTKSEAHIGKFDVPECKRLVDLMAQRPAA